MRCCAVRPSGHCRCRPRARSCSHGRQRAHTYAACWRHGRSRMAMQPGDEVETGPSAYALIRYPSGSEVFMRPRTRGRVGSFVDMVGEIFAKVRGAFAVQTTFVKAGAEGTAFSVRGTPAGDYELVVFDGTVRLS